MTQPQTLSEEQRMQLYSKLANRAAKTGEKYGVYREHVYWLLDFENADKDVGLKLEELLAADDSNFVHDAFGIYNHMNRETGKLEG
jgi:hypothetical protein